MDCDKAVMGYKSEVLKFTVFFFITTCVAFVMFPRVMQIQMLGE